MEGEKSPTMELSSSATTVMTPEEVTTTTTTAASVSPTTTTTATTPEIQIQLWKERNTKLEMYITKQKTRIGELEETETKLKRLLQMAKRSIDNTKQELIEKEQAMEKLRQEKTVLVNSPAKPQPTEETNNDTTIEPKRILLKVIHDGIIWCLIEYSRDREGTNITTTSLTEECQCQWKKFTTEKNLLDYVKNVHGEALEIPETSLSPIDAKKVKEQAKADVEKLKEEFRRYRVRAEILRKQKDAEIKKANANSVARHQEQLEGSDLQVELETCRTQLYQLSKIQNEMEDMDAMWKNKFAILQKENEKLKSQLSSPANALQKRNNLDATSKQDSLSPHTQSEIFATDLSKGVTGN